MVRFVYLRIQQRYPLLNTATSRVEILMSILSNFLQFVKRVAKIFSHIFSDVFVLYNNIPKFKYFPRKVKSDSIQAVAVLDGEII